MKKNLIVIITALTFIWCGLILGISFLEAPLKFQAPGITLPLGLGIGKLVFGVLSKIEMAIALFIIAAFLVGKFKISHWLLFAIPILILSIDTIFLLPILTERTDIIINGGNPPESKVHWCYVALEIVKFITLMGAGVLFLKRNIPSYK